MMGKNKAVSKSIAWRGASRLVLMLKLFYTAVPQNKFNLLVVFLYEIRSHGRVD